VKVQFPPEHYFEAARERLTDSAKLHAVGGYVASVYLSGVAVECMLLAYRTRDDPQFDARHDLPALMRASGIMEFIKVDERRDFAVHLGTIWTFWKNNLRYVEQSRFEKHLRTLYPNRGTELTVWASKKVYESAHFVITRGVCRWDSAKS
jgi:hypothetical protein